MHINRWWIMFRVAAGYSPLVPRSAPEVGGSMTATQFESDRHWLWAVDNRQSVTSTGGRAHRRTLRCIGGPLGFWHCYGFIQYETGAIIVANGIETFEASCDRSWGATDRQSGDRLWKDGHWDVLRIIAGAERDFQCVQPLDHSQKFFRLTCSSVGVKQRGTVALSPTDDRLH